MNLEDHIYKFYEKIHKFDNFCENFIYPMSIKGEKPHTGALVNFVETLSFLIILS